MLVVGCLNKPSGVELTIRVAAPPGPPVAPLDDKGDSRPRDAWAAEACLPLSVGPEWDGSGTINGLPRRKASCLHASEDGQWISVGFSDGSAAAWRMHGVDPRIALRRGAGSLAWVTDWLLDSGGAALSRRPRLCVPGVETNARSEAPSDAQDDGSDAPARCIVTSTAHDACCVGRTAPGGVSLWGLSRGLLIRHFDLREPGPEGGGADPQPATQSTSAASTSPQPTGAAAGRPLDAAAVVFGAGGALVLAGNYPDEEEDGAPSSASGSSTGSSWVFSHRVSAAPDAPLATRRIPSRITSMVGLGSAYRGGPSAATSPRDDAEVVAVGCADGTVRLLDTSSLLPLCAMKVAGEGPVLCMGASPCGGYIVCGGEGGVVTALALPPMVRVAGGRASAPVGAKWLGDGLGGDLEELGTAVAQEYLAPAMDVAAAAAERGVDTATRYVSAGTRRTSEAVSAVANRVGGAVSNAFTGWFGSKAT